MAKRTPTDPKTTNPKYRSVNRHGIALSAGPAYLAEVDALARKQRRSRSSLLEYAIYRLGQECGVEIGPRFRDSDTPNPDEKEG